VTDLNLRLASLLLALAGVACTSGTETGSSSTEHTVSIMALGRETMAQALELDQAWLSLHELSLLPCASDAAAVSTSDFPIDLFRDQPARVTFESAVSDYCGLHLEVAPSASAIPEALSGLSAFVSGVRSDDVPFELRSTLETSFDLTSGGGAFAASELVLGVDLEPWFVDADLDGASVTPDGLALVDAGDNSDVLAAFEGATAPALALYADVDGDGTLAGDELTPVAAPSP
jgi:hypothetical protein